MGLAYLLYQGIAGLSNNIEAFLEILHGSTVRISNLQIMGADKLPKQEGLILCMWKQLQETIAVSVLHDHDEISFLYVIFQQWPRLV